MRWCLVLLVACSNSNQLGSTDPGTQLIAWEADRAANELYLKNATIGAKQSRTSKLVLEVAERQVTLNVTVEAALVTQTLLGETRKASAPFTVTATVVDSGDVTLAKGGCQNQWLHLDGVGFTVQCSFGATRKTRNSSYEGGADFIVCADGRATPSLRGAEFANQCKP